MKVKLIAEELKELLAKENVLQQEFAKEMDISESYLSQIIKGIRDPSPPLRKKILSKFKRHKFDDLFKIIPNKERKTGTPSNFAL